MTQFFNPEWIKRYKPSLWFKFKLWLFGKPVIGVDRGASDVTVVARMYKGKIYITEVIK